MLQLYPRYNYYEAIVDTLWNSRAMTENFLNNCTSLSGSLGVSSVDENKIRCKGRTAAHSYMKSKPMKLGIRYYMVVSCVIPFLDSLWDKHYGNKTKITPPVGYCTLFRELRSVYVRKIDENLVRKDSPSALWCLQMCRQVKVYPTEGGPLYVIENFYARHLLAKNLLIMT